MLSWRSCSCKDQHRNVGWAARALLQAVTMQWALCRAGSDPSIPNTAPWLPALLAASSWLLEFYQILNGYRLNRLFGLFLDQAASSWGFIWSPHWCSSHWQCVLLQRDPELARALRWAWLYLLLEVSSSEKHFKLQKMCFIGPRAKKVYRCFKTARIHIKIQIWLGLVKADQIKDNINKSCCPCSPMQIDLQICSDFSNSFAFCVATRSGQSFLSTYFN